MSEIPYMMTNTRAEFERVRDLAWPATDRPHLADATDPRFTAGQLATLARFEAAPFPAEVLLAHLEIDEAAPWCNLPICPEGREGAHRITTGRCIVALAPQAEQ